MKGIFLLRPAAFAQIYGAAEVAAIEKMLDLYAAPQSAESIQADPSVLAQADVILSGWGMPKMDAEFLALAPRLQAVFYGAGSIKGIVTDAFWAHGIQITSAAAANAVPVVEYTLSQILFCLKLGWRHALEIRREQRYPGRHHVPGAYGSTVGLISLGLIGRRVCEMLRLFDVRVIAYDPFATPGEAAALGVELVALDELFQRADVVSLHAPWLKETERLITGAHFAAMKPNAAFINTARGAIVAEDEMIAILQQRPDLQAVLDVTYPEPPVPDSPLYTLPNVVLTPHIAGSLDDECRRMGRMMVDELARFLAGQPLHGAVTQAKEAISA
ncbi:MAG: hydroxyacid dehydrogenase [Caldilineaceae bacterium]|nr:hydroxyacid dehydrogenase [Caldilineaceae bacterium]